MFRAIKATAVLSTTMLVGGALLPSVSAHVIVDDNFLCRDDIPWMLPATYCDSWVGTTGGGSGGVSGGGTAGSGGSGGTGYAYDPWWRDGDGGSTSGNSNSGWFGGGGSGSGSGSGWFGGGGSTGSSYTGNPWWRTGSGGTVGGSSDREWFGGGGGGSNSGSGSGWFGGGGSTSGNGGWIGGSGGTGSRDPYDPWWRDGDGGSASGNIDGGHGWFGGGEENGNGSRDRRRNGNENGEYDDGTIGDDGYGGGGPLAWCDPTYTLETSWIRPKKRVVHIAKPPFTRAALSIEQSTDLPQGIAGQSIHYTIRVHNLSDYYATDIIVLDKILADLVCIEHAPLAYIGQRNLLWYVDFIAPHSSQLIQFRARIRPTVRRNTVVHNTVLAQTDGPHLRVIDVHDVGIVHK